VSAYIGQKAESAEAGGKVLDARKAVFPYYLPWPGKWEVSRNSV